MITVIICLVLLALLVPTLVAGRSLAPWLPSHDEDVQAALDLARAKPGETFYDLGCGEGHALLVAARRGLRATGVELAPLLFLAAKARIAFGRVAPGSAAVQYGDLFKKDISDADIIFVYGLPQALRGPFTDKVRREAKPEVRIVSCHFRISTLQEKGIGYSPEHNTALYLYGLA